MSPPFHLLLCLVHRPAEAVIYLLMDPVLILIPDQIRNIIDSSIEEMPGFPEILLLLTDLLPPLQPEPGLPV